MICFVIFLSVKNIECIINFRTLISNLEPIGSYAYLRTVTGATKCTFSEEEALVRNFSVSQIALKAGFTVEKAVIEARGLCHSCTSLA